MYKTLGLSFTGTSPLIQHNGKKLTNPLHPLTKEIKKITGKRTKTDDDLLALSKLEWLAGLYVTEDVGVSINGHDVQIDNDSARVCIPGDVLEGMLINGAKKNKLGSTFKAGIIIDDEPLLNFKNKDLSIEQLWQNAENLDVRAVRVQKNAVCRSRPIFYEWSIEFEVMYLPDVVNPEQITHAAEIGGMIVGLCDYRPRYGRFTLNE